jgi:CHAD domain-containing protein
MSPDGADRSYRFLDGEGLGEGARRIAAGRAEKAVERLRAIGSGEAEAEEAIHGARKDLKKLRTLLRLLRDELPKKVYAAEAERYREAGRLLSPLRDAEVKLETLEALAEGEPELPAEATEAWRLILARDREGSGDTTSDRAAEAEAIALIEAGRAGIEGWQVRDSWKAIGPGLERAYRRGRRRMRAARKRRDDDEAWHEWRKRAKDLWYAQQLLVGAWPRVIEPAAEEAHRLSEALGDHHDLALLRADLRERRLGEEETRALEAAIGRRQGELASAALDRGARLYAERPGDFTLRQRRYWRAWRG